MTVRVPAGFILFSFVFASASAGGEEQSLLQKVHDSQPQYPPEGAEWEECTSNNWNTMAYYKNTHAWMGDLHEAVDDEKWKRMKLGDLSVAGSHDAAIYWSEFSQDSYVTQSFTIRDQLCRGIRFFDIRLKLKKGVWTSVHPGWSILPDGWSSDWKSIMEGIKEFVNGPEHNDEVIYLRIKKETQGEESDFANLLTAETGLKPWLVEQNGHFDRIMLYNMKDLTTQQAQGAKVVLLAYNWKPPPNNKHIFQLALANKEKTVQTGNGRYSNTDLRSKLFTHTCGVTGCSEREKDGQFGSLWTWKEDINREGIMHMSWLTLTCAGQIRKKTAERLGKEKDGKNKYLVNDFLLMSTYNFGSPGNVVITDFCGDPGVWGDMQFRTTSNLKGSHKDGNGLVAALKAYNLAKMTSTGFVKCPETAPADKKVAGVCGPQVNAQGLEYSNSEPEKAISAKTGMVRDPMKENWDAAIVSIDHLRFNV